MHPFKHHVDIATKLLSIVGFRFIILKQSLNLWSSTCRICWIHSTAPAYDNRLLTLNIGLHQKFQWIFIVADVKHPILDADFLRHYNLLVDIGHNLPSDALTQLKVQGIATHDISPSPTLLSKQRKTEYKTLLAAYPEIIQPPNNEQTIKHNVTHHITTVGPPVSAHPCRLPKSTLD